MVEFCHCGSIKINGTCSANCHRRKPVEWGSENPEVKLELETRQSLTTARRETLKRMRRRY